MPLPITQPCQRPRPYLVFEFLLPAIEVAKILAEDGALVTTYEPFALDVTAPNCVAKGSLEDTLVDADAVVHLVDHRQFRQIKPGWVADRMPGRIAFDTRGVWDRKAWEEAGFKLGILGVGAKGD